MGALFVEMRIRNDPLVKLRVIEFLLRKNERMLIQNWSETPDPKDNNYLHITCGWDLTPSREFTISVPEMFEQIRNYKDPDIEFLETRPRFCL